MDAACQVVAAMEGEHPAVVLAVVHVGAGAVPQGFVPMQHLFHTRVLLGSHRGVTGGTGKKVKNVLFSFLFFFQLFEQAECMYCMKDAKKTDDEAAFKAALRRF